MTESSRMSLACNATSRSGSRQRSRHRSPRRRLAARGGRRPWTLLRTSCTCELVRLNRFNVTQNLEGIKLLRQAVARDSNFAAAYAELARRFMFLGYSRGSAYFDSGLVVANKAVAADPELAQSHFALGGIQGVTGRLAAGANLVSQSTRPRSELLLGDDGSVEHSRITWATTTSRSIGRCGPCLSIRPVRSPITT